MGHLWLIGMMGSGKSVVGYRVAERLSIPFYDTDATVERDTGASISSIFQERGEAAFRKLESIAVRDLGSVPDGIVATGGGVVLDSTNVTVMRASGTTVLLEVDTDTLEQRLLGSDHRPLIGERTGESLRTIAEARDGMYRSAADHVVDARGPIEEVAQELEDLWRRS